MNVISGMGLVLPVVYFFIGHTETEKQYLPLPTNITMRIVGPVNSWKLDLRWTWEPPVVNCTLLYPSIIMNGAAMKEPRCSPDPYIAIPLHQFEDLDNIFIDFKACCGPVELCQDLNAGSNSTCNGMESKGISLYTPLAAGEENTSVRNLSCVWYYLEYINCTWQPADVVPANVNYSLLYWVKNENTSYIGPTELKDLLDTGKPCHSYITNEDGMNVGCQFQLRKSIKNYTGLLIVVSDKLKNIKPFSLFKFARSIAKLRPPTIHNVSRIQNQCLYISWNTVHVNERLVYEVAYRRSANKKEEYEQTKDLQIEMLNVLPEDTFTVKVRVKPGDKGFWSEWSKEEVVTGIDHSHTIFIITLVVIPIVIVITVAILGIYIKRIKILIFPQIPDPGKMFQDNLQEWIKNDSVDQFKTPQKEQVCPVSVLEMPLTSAEVDCLCSPVRRM